MNAFDGEFMRININVAVQGDAVRGGAALAVRRNDPDLAEFLCGGRKTDQTVCGDAVIVCDEDTLHGRKVSFRLRLLIPVLRFCLSVTALPEES